MTNNVNWCENSFKKKKTKKKTERIKENDKLYKGSDVLMYFN